MKQRPAFEPIPPLLQPQKCVGPVIMNEKCDEPAVWVDTQSGDPLCEGHKQLDEKYRHLQEITPP